MNAITILAFDPTQRCKTHHVPSASLCEYVANHDVSEVWNHLPDANEAGESRAERWADAYLKTIGGKTYFRCDCGSIVSLESAVPRSPDPYSIPVCRRCARLEEPTA